MGRPRGEAADAYQRALGLLVRREHSRRDLSRKLAQRGVEPAEADAAVERLAEQGYQDDGRFAASFARDRASSGYGPVRIRVELAGHGLGEDAIQLALDACEADWPASARRQVERRWTAAVLAEAEAIFAWVWRSSASTSTRSAICACTASAAPKLCAAASASS